MAKKKRVLTDWIGFTLLHFLIFFRRLFGRSAALGLGSGVGALYFAIIRISKKRYKITEENLKTLYPRASEEELESIIWLVCRHWGRFLLEGCGLPHFDKALADKIVEFEEDSLDRIGEAHKKGAGVIFATAHFGNFEIGNGAVALAGYPVWSVIRTVDNLALDRLMDKSRCATGLGVIKKENSAREILKHLRSGDIVTINIDQNASVNSVFIPFFGKLAATFTTPAVMGLRTGAPVLPVYCFRDDINDRYLVRVYPEVEPPKTGDKSADIRLMTSKINKILEEVIKEAPHQWLWVHRRWKSRPGPEDMAAIERDRQIIEQTSKQDKSAAS